MAWLAYEDRHHRETAFSPRADRGSGLRGELEVAVGQGVEDV
jgi:hypothetical protein